MAYDSLRRVTVLFGGGCCRPGQSCFDCNDTWEWDGTDWTEHSPASMPSPRERFGLAYDEERGVTVLFGGSTFDVFPTVYCGDTWEWDGANWIERQPSVSPSFRHGHAMAFDTVKGQVLLFGGSSGPPPSPCGVCSDLWRY